MNLLFVCSRNQWRSPTAEAIFKNSQEHCARSAGTEPSARIKITSKLINWADIIFVMEKRHKERLQEKFRGELTYKKIVVLNISDNYHFMDKELIEILEKSLEIYL